MAFESRLQDLELKHVLLKENVWDLTRRFCNLEYLVTSHLVETGGHSGHVETYFNTTDDGRSVEREVLDFNSKDLYITLLQRISNLELITAAGQFYDHGDTPCTTTSTHSTTSSKNHGRSDGHMDMYPMGTRDQFENNQNYFEGGPTGTNSTVQIPTQLNLVETEKGKASSGRYIIGNEGVLKQEQTTRSRPKKKKTLQQNNIIPGSNVSLDLEPQIVKIFQQPSPDPEPLLGNYHHHHHIPVDPRPSSIASSTTTTTTTTTTTAVPPKTKQQKKGRVKCQKICNTSKPGHVCGITHKPSDKCPPCSFNFRGVPYKCGHMATTACHLRKKVASTPCKKCTNDPNSTSKLQGAKFENKNVKPTKILTRSNNDSGYSQKNEAPPSFSKPDTQFPAQTKFTYDHKFSSNESILTRVREMIDEMTMINCETLSEEFVELLAAHPNLIPKLATTVFDKAVISSGQMSPRCYNKLITRIKKENDLMKGFFEKLVELTFNLFLALFSNNTGLGDNRAIKVTAAVSVSNSISSTMTQMFVTKFDTPATLSHKSHGVLKFIGELYKTDVISCADMKVFVDKLLANPLEINLDYLCKLLNLVGHKLSNDINELDASTPAVSSELYELPTKVWLKSTYDELSLHCSKPDQSDSIRSALERVTKLQANRWASEQQTKEKFTADLKEPESISNNEDKVDSSTRTMIDSEGVEWEFYSSSDDEQNRQNIPIETGEGAAIEDEMPPISAPVFSETFMHQIYLDYMKLENQPKSVRIEWMQKRFKIYLGREILTFVREFPYFAVELKESVELAGAAHFVDIMIASSIITKELVIDAFISGILFNLQQFRKKKEKNYKLILDNLAYFVLTIFNHEKDLNWLVSLGETLHKENPKIWNIFSTKVLEKKQARFKKNPTALHHIWENTGSGKEILIEQAVKLMSKA